MRYECVVYHPFYNIFRAETHIFIDLFSFHTAMTLLLKFFTSILELLPLQCTYSNIFEGTRIY